VHDVLELRMSGHVREPLSHRGHVESGASI
jgi:hypothetical protein